MAETSSNHSRKIALGADHAGFALKEVIKTLLNTGNNAIVAFTKKDLLREEVDIERLWTLPRVKKLLRKIGKVIK